MNKMKKLTMQQIIKDHPEINDAWGSMSKAFIEVKKLEAASKKLKKLTPEEIKSYLTNHIYHQCLVQPEEIKSPPTFKYKGVYADITYYLS